MFKNMTEVKRANKNRGGHFFDAQAMRYFGSKVESPLIGGRWFVTSERYNEDFPKLYTVREVQEDASIRDASEFQEFKTLDEALTFIARPTYRTEMKAYEARTQEILRQLAKA